MQYISWNTNVANNNTFISIYDQKSKMKSINFSSFYWKMFMIKLRVSEKFDQYSWILNHVWWFGENRVIFFSSINFLWKMTHKFDSVTTLRTIQSGDIHRVGVTSKNSKNARLCYCLSRNSRMYSWADYWTRLI